MDNEIIRITKLKGLENWTTWKFQVCVIPKANGIWDIVNGTSALSEQYAGSSAEVSTKAIALWKKNDNIAQRIIATSVEEQPLLRIINCETSKAMWDKLTSVYEQKSEASVHMLLQQWYSLKKNPSDDIATHVSILDLAHRLQVLGEKIPDSMIITKVLMTLPSSYKHFVSAWDSTQSDDRTLANLVSRLTIEETRVEGRDKTKNRAFTAHKQGNKKSEKQKFEKPGTCHYCHKPGYWIRDCRERKSANVKQDSDKEKGEVLVGEFQVATLSNKNDA